MKTLKEDVLKAVEKAYEKLENMVFEDFVEGVETARCMIYNTHLECYMVEKFLKENKKLGDIRKEKPRLFGEIIGRVYADKLHRDRLYNIRKHTDDDFIGYNIEGFILTPEIPPEKFKEKAKDLKKMLSKYGNSGFEKSRWMKHVEGYLDNFHKDSKLGFRKTMYLNFVQMNREDAYATNMMDEFFLMGSGYAVSKNKATKKPEGLLYKGMYKGHFLTLIMKGHRKTKKMQFEILDKALDIIGAEKIKINEYIEENKKSDIDFKPYDIGPAGAYAPELAARILLSKLPEEKKEEEE